MAKEIDLTGRPRLLDKWQPKWIRDKYFGGRDVPDSKVTPAKKNNTKK
jgi:hypothetical protein